MTIFFINSNRLSFVTSNKIPVISSDDNFFLWKDVKRIVESSEVDSFCKKIESLSWKKIVNQSSKYINSNRNIYKRSRLCIYINNNRIIIRKVWDSNFVRHRSIPESVEESYTCDLLINQYKHRLIELLIELLEKNNISKRIPKSYTKLKLASIITYISDILTKTQDEYNTCKKIWNSWMSIKPSFDENNICQDIFMIICEYAGNINELPDGKSIQI